MEEREETHGEPEHRSEEELLWQSHPSHWVYFWRYVLCLVLIAGGIALMVWQHSNKYLLIAGLVLVGAGVIAFLIIHLCRTRTTLTVTSRNVSYEGGIFQRDAVDVPIHSITEMWVEQSLLQRLAGIGTIGFSSSASTETEIVCRGMPHPDRIRQIVRDHMS